MYSNYITNAVPPPQPSAYVGKRLCRVGVASVPALVRPVPRPVVRPCPPRARCFYGPRGQERSKSDAKPLSGHSAKPKRRLLHKEHHWKEEALLAVQHLRDSRSKPYTI